MVSVDTYINESTLPYPFCPGCGHSMILDRLNEALLTLDLDPRKVVLVTDIGCCGLSDRFFSTNALHGLHGRSVTYATGMKLANPELTVIVLIGDGGVGIGLNHLVNAARRNIGISVLVFNNLNYGMTGGEHSTTTPLGSITATTWYGHLEQPLDICATLSVNGASFIARTTVFDKALPELLTKTISGRGFSLIDVWELCTAYYVPNNKFSRKLLEKTMEECGFSAGIISQIERPEYSSLYEQSVSEKTVELEKSEQGLEVSYQHSLASPLEFLVAGKAGNKINSTASLFSHGAVLSGLWATQRNDYPVTVKSGYSVSEVMLSPVKRRYTGFTKPDVLVVLSREGLEKISPYLDSLTEDDQLIINRSLIPVQTAASVLILDFDRTRLNPKYWALMAIAEYLRTTACYPIEALKRAVEQNQQFVEENLKAIENSAGILIN